MGQALLPLFLFRRDFMYSFEFNAPTKIICERGAIAKAGALAAELGSKALI